MFILSCQDEVNNTRSAQRSNADSNCNGEPAEKSLAIVNGRASDQHRSVALLLRERISDGKREVAICTGTFIGDNALITAGHCIDDSPNGGVVALIVDSYDTAVVNTEAGFEQARQRGVTALQVFHHGLTHNELISSKGEAMNLDKTNLDLAVVLFPNGTSKYASPLAEVGVKQGDKGLIVGFGQASFSPSERSTHAKKREGDVVVAGPQTGVGLISLYSRDLSGKLGTAYASSASGDSGGPLFVNGTLAGVSSSSGDFGGDYGHVSVYVDMTSKESKELIQRAVDGGANIFNAINGDIKPNSQVSPGC